MSLSGNTTPVVVQPVPPEFVATGRGKPAATVLPGDSRASLPQGGGGGWCEPSLGADVAPCSPLFIPFETNCTQSVSSDLATDCDYCGQYTLVGTGEGKTKFKRMHCRTWKCPRCGKKRAILYRFRIGDAAAQYGLDRFLTLHLDPKKIPQGADPVKFLRQCFARLRSRWRRRFGVAPKYIAVLEYQQNGNPHLHLLVDRFMWWRRVLADWQAVGGGGFWILRVKLVGAKNVTNYLSKYLTKDSVHAAGRYVRRVVCARGIALIGALKDATWRNWRMHQRVIDKIFSTFQVSDAGRILNVELEIGTNVLQCFEVRSP